MKLKNVLIVVSDIEAPQAAAGGRAHTRGNNHEEGKLDILRCFLHLSGREADRNAGIPGVGYR